MRAAMSTEDNHKRPGRYILLQQVEAQVFGKRAIKSSLEKAFIFKEKIGLRRWQDVIEEQ